MSSLDLAKEGFNIISISFFATMLLIGIYKIHKSKKNLILSSILSFCLLNFYYNFMDIQHQIAYIITRQDILTAYTQWITLLNARFLIWQITIPIWFVLTIAFLTISTAFLRKQLDIKVLFATTTVNFSIQTVLAISGLFELRHPLFLLLQWSIWLVGFYYILPKTP